MENNVISTTIVIDASRAKQELKQLEEALNKLKQYKQDTPLISSNSEQGITKFASSYKQAISSMTSDIEKFHRLFKETGNVEYQNKVNALIPQVRQLSAEYNALNKSIGLNTKSAGLLDGAFGNIKNHASWLMSSAMIGGAIALPGLAIKSMAHIEQQMAGMLQTLPSLYADYPNHIVDQKALNDVTQDFIGISQRYGFEVDKVIEAGKLWSRGYKEVGTVMSLTGNSTKLAIADMMDVGLANRAVESNINSFKRQGDAVNFSNHIVDSWTNVSHNAQTSATDLAEAMIRSAAAANVVGISFDTATALAATMVKNTGQAGSVVGNSLKAIYSNIHSSKAIKDIEAMGIAVYKFDEDGTKHFRNVEQVLIDLMTKVQGTKVNLEDVMKDVGGGRFQWSRVAALLGDYSEFIKNYNLSLLSAGSADRQVLAQLDTITRKAEQVQASMQGVLMGAADAGAARFIKDTLDTINSFIKGLQQIPTGVYAATGSIAKWTVTIYTANTALKFLESGIMALTVAKTANVAATVAEGAAQTTTNIIGADGSVISRVATGAKTAEAIATTELAVANGALAATTTAVTGGLNLALAALIATGIGASIYATSVGDAATQQENLKQHSIDLLAVKQQEYEMLGKQTEFIGTLGNAYNEFNSRLQATGETTEQGIQIRKSMTATETELKNIVGEAGLERLRSAGYSVEAIESEKTVHNEAATAMKTEINDLKVAQNIFTDNQITNVEKRIDSLYKETEALSFWRKAQLAAYDMYAGIIDKQIAFKSAIFNNMPDFMQAEKSQLGQSIDSDIAYRESLTTTSRAGLNDDIAQAKAELAKLRKEKLERSISNYQGSTVGGDEVTDKPGKKTKTPKVSTSLANPPDDSEKINRMELGREVSHMFAESKLAADKYSASLEILNTKESMFGFSTENSNAKLAIMNKHILELIGQSMEYSEQGRDYEQQAADKVASNSDLVASLEKLRLSWKSLTLDEKKHFLQDNKSYVQDMETLNKLLELSDKLNVASVEAAKKASGIGTDTAKLTLDIPMQKYKKQAQIDGQDKNHEIAGLGYNATDEQKRVIEVKYAVKELFDAQQELNRVTALYGTDSEQYREAREKVDNLKNSVDKLNNTQLDKVKSEVSDMIIELAQGGKSFGDIWKNVWKEFQADAIKSLMGVKHEASLLGSLLGGKGSAGGGGLIGFIGGLFGAKTPKKAHSGENITTNAPKMHSGGEVTADAPLKNDEVLRTLQVGERVLSKDANRSFMGIQGSLGKLGLLNKGTQVTANVSQRTLDIAQQASATQKLAAVNAQHLERLDKQIGLMTQQNNMLLHIINNGDQGNSTVAQPIVMPTTQSDDTLFAQLSRMRSKGYQI